MHIPQQVRIVLISHVRIAFVALTALLILSGCQPSEKPNIILITIDTTRADHLSCYGYEVKTTPNLERIANNGVRFDFAIAQSSITPMSCASQLTGRYPYNHGLRALHGYKNNSLPENVPLIQEEFQKMRYETAAFVSAFPASSAYGIARGFKLFDEAFLDDGRNASISVNGIVNTGNSQRTAKETNAKVLPWLRENAQKPFFLWLHYFDPHDTNFIPPGSIVEPFLRASPGEDRPEFLRSVYDAEIAFTDEHIGQVISAMEELGIKDKTILVITADHGEGLGDHDWWKHGILYQEQIRAPLIFSGPGIQQGHVVQEMVEHVDIFPTLLDLVKPGRSAKIKGLDGRSLLPALQGSTLSKSARPAFSEVHNVQDFGRSHEVRQLGEIYSLILDHMKLIHYPRNPARDELYDLKEDPRELKNLINEKRKTADALLADLRKRNAIDHYAPNPATLSPEKRKHLKSLGYIN